MLLAVSPAPLAHPARGDLLDVALALAAVAVGVTGARRGFVLGIASAVGLLTGGLAMIRFAPGAVGHLINPGGTGPGGVLGQRLVVGAVIVAGGAVGEALAVAGVRPLRARLGRGPLAQVDAAGGAVFEVGGMLLLTWLLTSALALQPGSQWRAQVRGSAILHAVDDVAPAGLRRWPVQLNRMFQQHVMPYFADPFGAVPVPGQEVPAPDPATVPALLGSATNSIVKIVGEAPSCSRISEGSGFVYASQHVMTNAHVVAGTRTLRVEVPGGQTLDATVVLYDPHRDVAVLFVPGLTRAPLTFAPDAATGTKAVVAGYPGGGPFTANAARVAGRQEVTGPDIYSSHTVTREVYTLRARVRPGNSGGPLIVAGPRVAGVVFAASIDHPDVGYALSADEVRGDADAARTSTASVPTGGCT